MHRHSQRNHVKVIENNAWVNPTHALQLYTEPRALASQVADFVSDGIVRGEAALLITNPIHVDPFTQALNARGQDIARAQADGLVLWLNARELLAGFMVDGRPDAARVDALLGSAVGRLLSLRPRLRAYGEMVNILTEEGNARGALMLEGIWNDLIADKPIRLLCGYHLEALARDRTPAVFGEVCATHRAVYAARPEGDGPPQHNPLLAELQYKSRVVEIESDRRSQLEYERLQLFKSEREARLHAESVVASLAKLQRATSALSEAVSPKDVARVVMTELSAAVASAHAVLAIAVPDEPQLVTLLDPLAGSAPLLEAAFASGQSVWRSSPEGADFLPGSNSVFSAVACLPLVARGTRLGAIGFGFATTKEFTPTLRTLMEDIARQVSLALERASLFEEAQLGHEQLQLVTDSLPVFIAYLGRDLRYHWVNARYQSLGYTRENAIGKSMRELLGETAFEHLRPYVETALRGDTVSFERWIPFRAGHSRFMRGTYVPRRRPDGCVEGFIALVMDITDENARLLKEAQVAMGVRDDFLSNAGHELKTPLTALQLQLHSVIRMLQSEQPADAAVLRAEKAVRNVARLNGLVNELLDISDISAGRLTLEKTTFNLCDAVRDAVERAREKLSRAGCTVELTMEPQIVGHWDRRRIEQVMGHLLSNAAKYGKGESVEVRVALDGRHAVVSVRDHGMGISEHDQKRLFQRFERAVSSRHFGGLGLGLWVCRQLVEAHQGSIRVQSVLEEGALFEIELPLA